jgi:vancomycin resistance protein VanJ
MPRPEQPLNHGFWHCQKCGTPNPWAIYLTDCMGCGTPRVAAAATPRAEGGADSTAPKLRPRPTALLAWVAGYAVVLVGAYVILRGIGDAWWPGAMLMLGPRAVFLLPILPMAAWAFGKRRWRIGAMTILEALFVLGPLMGFVIPLGRESHAKDGPTLRIMSFNRARLLIDPEEFLRYIDRQKIDVICFQEEPRRADPLEDRLKARGWQFHSTHLLASRYPIVSEPARAPEENFDLYRYTGNLYRARIKGPMGREFVVASLHMPTLRPCMMYLLKADFTASRALLTWWDRELERMFTVASDSEGLPTLVAGDFNQGPEASRLLTLRGSGEWRSAFDEAGLGWGYTRPAGFAWTRIDHIMVGSDWTISGCWVGPAFGSDHRSMIAEVGFPASPPARP